MYTYLLINIATLSIPLWRSFETRYIDFKAKWKFLFPAIFIVAAFFLIWDSAFEHMGIWSFNDEYILPFRIAGLPIGEWLFFFTVPYACLFIYEVLNRFISKDTFMGFSKYISYSFIIILALLALLNYDKWYTCVTFSLTSIFIAFLEFNKTAWLSKFYRAYTVCLIPFFIVNGILTSWPVVQYNDAENLGIRIGSIPVEDTIYGMLLLMMVTYFYEKFKSRAYAQS